VKVVKTADIGCIEQRNKDFRDYWTELNVSIRTGLRFSESELVRVIDSDGSHPNERTQSPQTPLTLAVSALGRSGTARLVHPAKLMGTI
jgi:hypothetical protein